MGDGLCNGKGSTGLLAARGCYLPLMPRLTSAQRDARRIERLEQTRLILQNKISVLAAALEKTEAELSRLTG